MIKSILISLRPNVWMRIAAEMFLGACLAPFTVHNIPLFFLGFFLVGPCIGGSSYLLNDISDKKYDTSHKLRKHRPIALGKLSTQSGLLAYSVLVFFACIVSFVISKIFFIGICTLIISEFFYTLGPFRWKERAGLDVFLNATNSLTRFILGYTLAGGIFSHIPILFLGFALGIKLIFFLGHRWQNREQEKIFGYKSTVVFLSKTSFFLVMGFLLLVTILCYYGSIFIYGLPHITLIYPPIAFLLLFPILQRIQSGYLSKQEVSQHMRNYLYGVFFLFSFSLLLTIHLVR